MVTGGMNDYILFRRVNMVKIKCKDTCVKWVYLVSKCQRIGAFVKDNGRLTKKL